MAEIKLKNKAVDFGRLESFGFVDGRYEKNICANQFTLALNVAQDGKIFSKVVDNFSHEEYILHLVENSVGSYVGAVRAEYDAVINDFVAKCCVDNIFRAEMTRRLIEYVRETYGGELEFLWENLPDAAIWRRQDTRKWYGVLMNIPERKLNLDSKKIVDVVNLRGDALALADGAKIFPGWHMNKKSWITIRLDGSLDFAEICRRLDESFNLAVK